MSKQDESVKTAVLTTVDSVCKLLLPIVLSVEKSNSKSFVERCDPGVITSFVSFLTKILEVGADVLVENY